MRISLSSIVYLASEGRLTLQVPDTTVIFNHPQRPGLPVAVPNESVATDVIDAPDDWFCYLRRDVPAVGRESGFLHLTRKGYEANKERLRAAFSNKRGASWEDFEKAAEAHFAEVEKKLAKAIRNAEQKLTQLRNITV